MGFKERNRVMDMIQSVFRSAIEIPDDDKRDVLLFVDCSLVLWPLIVARLSNFDADRNFLETVDEAFIAKLVLPFHDNMLLLAGSLKRKVTIIYVADSAPPPFKKINRTSSHLLLKGDMERMRDAHCFTKSEIVRLSSFTPENVLDAVIEDSPLLEDNPEFGDQLRKLVSNGAIPMIGLCTLTKCKLQFDAINALLGHREIATANLKNLYTASGSIPLTLLASLMTPPESRIWETIRNDSRMRRACIDIANGILRNKILSPEVAMSPFASTMLVGLGKCYYYRSVEYAMDASMVSEADDIIMRLTHDPAFNYVIIGNDSDTAGYYFLHHTTPCASRVFWVEDWRKMLVYELSAFVPRNLGNLAIQDYLRVMVFLWIVSCNNDFIKTNVSTSTSPEMVPILVNALRGIGGKETFEALWNDHACFATTIAAWLAAEPRCNKDQYRFVVYPDGTRKKQCLDPGARPSSSGVQIAENLYYWSKKELFLFNKN